MQTYFKLFNNVVKTMIWTLAKFWEDLCVITLKHTVRKTYLRNNGALMQTFSLPCFSSSNRVGGVAHDCVKTASKLLFPWLQASFCFRTVVLSHPEWGATRFYIEWIKRWTRTERPYARHLDAKRCTARSPCAVLVILHISTKMSTFLYSHTLQLLLFLLPYSQWLLLTRIRNE